MDREQFVRRCRGRYGLTRQHDLKGVVDVVEMLPLVVRVPIVDVVEQEWGELSGRIDKVIAAAAAAAGEAMELEGEREEREGRERSGLCEDVGDRSARESAESDCADAVVGDGGVCEDEGGRVEDAEGGDVFPPVSGGRESPLVQPAGAEGFGEAVEVREDLGGGSGVREVREGGAGGDVDVERGGRK